MQTHDIIELPGVLNPAFPTPADVAPPQVAAEVGRGSWKRGFTPEKHVAVFIKKLRFPSEAMTAKDAEWEAWRQRNLTTLRNRICATSDLDPSFVLKPYGYRFKETPCLVVPRVDGGNIFQFVNGHSDFTESRKLALLYDAARAIAYLHSQSPPIVHGRIHPTEILVNNQGRAILFDFGIHHAVANLERSPPQSTSETVLPDGGYCAPEILKGQVLTPAADVYAFAGVILVVMTGKHPHNDHPSPIMAWMEGKPEPRDHPALPSSHPLWELMNEMWAVPPTERPTMLRVTESLEYLLETQGYSVTFNSEPVEHEDSTDADEQSDPYEEPNPHLKEFVDEAIRLVDLSRIGTSFSFSELLQRLDHELAPELDGELVELDPNVAQGTYAFVSRCQWKTLRPDGTVSETCVAVKALRIGRMSALEKEARISIRLKRESRVWLDLNHENILQLCGFKSQPGEACLISPWCDKGDLYSFLEKNRDMEVAPRLDLAAQVGKGLTYLHKRSPPIGHGDIKPHNVLLTKNLTAKICDFGLSRAIQELPTGYTTGNNVGTDGYRAPELWLGGRPSLEGDVYAYGGLVLKCYTFKDPFQGVLKHTVAEAVLGECQVSPPHVHDVQPEDSLYRYMCWCCQALPADRPNIEQAVIKLEKDIGVLKSSGSPSDSTSDK